MKKTRRRLVRTALLLVGVLGVFPAALRAGKPPAPPPPPPPPVLYDITWITALSPGVPSRAKGINNLGDTVGVLSSTGAYLYAHAPVGLRDLNGLIDPASGWFLRGAVDVNNPDANGVVQVIGTGTLNGESRAFRLLLHIDRATGVVSAGPLLELPGGNLAPRGMNDLGDVVGGGVGAYVITAEGGFQLLNDLIDPTTGWDLSFARAINNQREIVGYGYRNGTRRAFRLKLGDAVPQDLGVLNSRAPDSQAWDINESGDVAGWSTKKKDGTPLGLQHAFLYADEQGIMRDLGSLGSGSSMARGINTLGDIVGGSVKDNKWYGFLFTVASGYPNGYMFNLDDLVDPTDPDWLRWSTATRVGDVEMQINDLGEICGSAEFYENGNYRYEAFLLTPIP